MVVPVEIEDLSKYSPEEIRVLTHFRARRAKIESYRATRVREVEDEIAQHERKRDRAKEVLILVKDLTEEEVLKQIKDNEFWSKEEKEELEKNARAERAHEFALRMAYEKGKGILPPHKASERSTSFFITGLMVGGLFTWGALMLWGVRNEIWLILSAVVGAIAGSFISLHLFESLFVVDQSMDDSYFMRAFAAKSRAIAKGLGSK